MKRFKNLLFAIATIMPSFTANAKTITEKIQVDYDYQKLIDEATQARENAYAPNSNFKVGAALLTKDGKIFTGCNIEYTIPVLGLCAERTALAKAISEGYKDFKAIAVIANSPDPCAPCGVCRQALLEFSTDMDIVMTNIAGKIRIQKITELVPHYFSAKELEFNNQNPEK